MLSLLSLTANLRLPKGGRGLFKLNADGSCFSVSREL
jgi:hypothetical protein